MKPYVLILCLSLLSLPLFGETSEALFTQGNEAFHQNDYEAALKAYQEALHLGESAALHFNIANTFLQLGELGRARYHYERALLIEPRNPDVLENRAHLLEKLKGFPEERPWYFTPMGWYPVSTWAWAAVLSFWLGLILFLFPRFYRGRGLFLNSILLVCVFTFLLSKLVLTGYHFERFQGIVLEEAPLKVSPTDSSQAASYLPAGALAQLKKEHGAYVYLEGPNNKEGWMRASAFKDLWD